MIPRIALLMLLSLSPLSFASAQSREPNWDGRVVAVGQQRAEIQSKPMIHRPYRPFHFYGNTVRRRYYRGTAVPRTTDVVQGLRAVLGR